MSQSLAPEDRPLAELPAMIEHLRTKNPVRTEEEQKAWLWQYEIVPHLKGSRLPERFWYQATKWKPKQWEVFKQVIGLLKGNGAIIALVGKRGCVSGDTCVYDPIARTALPVAELYRRAQSLHVYSLTPQGIRICRASAPFVKGFSPLLKVSFECGASITVASEHKFLTPLGWLPLSALGVGSVLGCSPDPGSSNAEFVHQDFEPGAEHYSQTVPDFRDDYFAYSRLGDEQLRYEEGNAPSFLPLRAGVLECNQPLSNTDALVSKLTRNHPCLCSDHRSTNHSRNRYEHFADTVSSCRNFIRWTRIRTITIVGSQLYYDLSVPGAKNYWAQGVWNHNTGKTTICAQIILERAFNEGLVCPWHRRPPYRKLAKLVAQYKSIYSDHGSIDTEQLLQAHDQLCVHHPLMVIDECHDCDELRVKNRFLTDTIDKRYSANNDTILISNQTPEQFMETTDDSVLSRLKENGQIVHCTWESWR